MFKSKRSLVVLLFILLLLVGSLIFIFFQVNRANQALIDEGIRVEAKVLQKSLDLRKVRLKRGHYSTEKTYLVKLGFFTTSSEKKIKLVISDNSKENFDDKLDRIFANKGELSNSNYVSRYVTVSHELYDLLHVDSTYTYVYIEEYPEEGKLLLQLK